MSREAGVLGIQVGWTPDKKDNLSRALKLIDEAFTKYSKIDLICMPEIYYTCPDGKNNDFIGEDLSGPFVTAYRECARKYKVNIVTGTFCLKKDDKLYNTCLCINRDGEIVGEYSKTHLFDAFNTKESDNFTPGNELCIVDLDFGRIGVAVCYELRFQDYIRTLCLNGAELLVVPAAFYSPRHDHWDILCNSAALGNLTYLLAVNQYSHECVGRSRVVDPFGLIISQASDREQSIYALIDLDYEKETRKKVPSYENRRPELYSCDM